MMILMVLVRSAFDLPSMDQASSGAFSTKRATLASAKGSLVGISASRVQALLISDPAVVGLLTMLLAEGFSGSGIKASSPCQKHARGCRNTPFAARDL